MEISEIPIPSLVLKYLTASRPLDDEEFVGAWKIAI